MGRTTISIRVDDELKEQLADVATSEGISVEALIQRFIREELAMDRHPGVFFQKGPAGRRATLRDGPDVWEVAMSIPRMTGTERERIQALAEEFGLPERTIVTAINYMSDYPEEIEQRIRMNEMTGDMLERREEVRKRLLA